MAKQYASAFFGTSLAATLHAGGVDTVVIAGVSSSGCIRATATDARGHGFRPQVVRDACADRTLELHEQNLRDPRSTPTTWTRSALWHACASTFPETATGRRGCAPPSAP